MNTEKKEKRKRKKDRAMRIPFWVKFPLLGISRTTASFSFYASVLLSFGCGIGGFFFAPVWIGLLFLVSAFWYWQAIQWMDVHGGWEHH